MLKELKYKGIYYVVYTISLEGKVMYVGCSSDYKNRCKQHLARNKKWFHSAIPDDVDLSKITFDIIRKCRKRETALKYEQKMISKYKTIQTGWNIRRSGQCSLDKTSYLKNWKRKHPNYDQEWRDNNRDHYNEYNREWRKKKRQAI